MRSRFANSLKLAALVAASVIGIASTFGCGLTGTSSDAPDPVVLRTYTAPAGYESQVPSMLRSAFGDTGGRVSVGPAGTLLVLATENVQRGVRTFLDQLAATGGPPPTPKPITMSYWIVLGAPAAGNESSAVDVALREIEPALAEISSSQGAQRFKLLERAQLASAGDDWGQSQGKYLTVEQRVTQLQEVVMGEIRLRLRSHSLATEIKLDPGQIVVLGQTGVDDWTQTAEFKPETLYYVITARSE